MAELSLRGVNRRSRESAQPRPALRSPLGDRYYWTKHPRFAARRIIKMQENQLPQYPHHISTFLSFLHMSAFNIEIFTLLSCKLPFYFVEDGGRCSSDELADSIRCNTVGTRGWFSIWSTSSAWASRSKTHCSPRSYMSLLRWKFP